MDYNILNHISDAFIIVNLKTENIEYFNTQAKILLKLPSEKIVKISRLFENENQWSELKSRAINFLSKNPSIFPFTLPIRTYDNSYFSAVIRCGYTDDTKKTLYLTFSNISNAVIDDVDFRSFTEMALSGFAIVTVDNHLPIKYANNAFYRILDLDIEQYSGLRSFLRNIYPKDKERLMRNYKTQLQNKECINLEYRIVTKENKLKWIWINGNYIKHASGFDEIYCSVSEISERKELLDQLVAERHFYSIAKDTTEDIVFQFTLQNNYMEQYGNSVAKFGIPSTIENFPSIAIEKGIIAQEDIPIFLQLFDNMRASITIPLEFRMIDVDNNVVWYRVEYKLLFNKEIPIQASGKILNIQRRKLLEETASTDPLTKCLNKKSIEEIVTPILEKSIADEQHAFLIIDVDDFKNVNDSLGHHFGDLVLAEVSKKLRKSFRDSDYVGRIGGDEFVIFIKNISDLSMLIKKANLVTKIFQIVNFKENSHYKISCSIGISRFPIDGRVYDDLYKKADIALYNSKDKGKNCYSLYNDALSKGTMINKTPLENAGKLLSEHYYNNTISIVFDLLYESNDIDESINIILSLIGTQLGVDRCHISETEDNGEHFSNTFEWCNTNITSEIDSLQNLPTTVFDYIFPRANRDGIFYCNDLTKLTGHPLHDTINKQGIKSFLFSIAKKNDNVNLFMGFDDCTKARIWTGKEIATLMYVSKIIAIFLARKKNLKELINMDKKHKEILNNTQNVIYVVNKNTHEVLYTNKKALEVIADIEIGATCYSSVRGYTDVCPDCPLEKLNEECKVFTCEIWNEKANVRTLTTAATIKWDDKIDTSIIYSINLECLSENQKSKIKPEN